MTMAHQRWSPDGCSIIFDSEQNYRYTIQIVDLDGQNLRTLIKDTKAHYQQPAWSRANDLIVFSSNYYEYSPYFKEIPDLFEIRLDGTGMRRITNNPGSSP